MVKKTIGVILVLLSGTVYGQLYKCVGPSGNVEYASVCPPGTRQQDTGIRNTPGAGTAAAPQKSVAERDADFRKRQMEKQETAAKQEKKSAEEEQHQRSCESSRSYLASLKSGARISRTDPMTGERSFLEDADRAREIDVAQRAVDASCN